MSSNSRSDIFSSEQVLGDTSQSWNLEDNVAVTTYRFPFLKYIAFFPHVVVVVLDFPPISRTTDLISSLGAKNLSFLAKIGILLLLLYFKT